MILPLREAAVAFKKAHPEIVLDQTFDNAITLARRIRDKGEQCDLFVSPGASEIGLLEAKGLVDATTKKLIGKFELVVYAPKASTLKLEKPDDLLELDTISCPNPEWNSVGTYAKQSLTKLGLWDRLEKRTTTTEFAIDSHKFVAAGKTQAGFGYRSCPLDSAPEKLSKSKVKIAFAFPPDSYAEAGCYIALLNGAAHREQALAYVSFLTSPEGQKVLQAQGLPGAGAVSGTAASASGTTPTAAAPTAAAAKVKVEAYYPDNEGHAAIKKLVLGLAEKYPGKVSAEFTDFTSDQGYEKWHAAGLTCGGILINKQQTFKVKHGAKTEDVTFMMGMGGEWQQADLEQVVAGEVAKAYPK
jgi:molybdate transport system substrate-binding protein